MRGFSKDESGSSLVELTMVMALTIIFGFAVFTVMQVGSHTEQRLINDKNAQADARVALSFINVSLRKNDATGKIQVAPVDHTGRNGIVIRHRSFDDAYDSWIYFSAGNLRECRTEPGEQPQDHLSTEIVEIYDFDLAYDEERNALTTYIEYEYGERIEEITGTVNLRNTRLEGIIL